MGNRGSKSVFENIAVKEQRVNGSYRFIPSACRGLERLRCTLLGFERNYQVKIPSNPHNK